MKKCMTLLLTAVLVLALAACGSGGSETTGADKPATDAAHGYTAGPNVQTQLYFEPNGVRIEMGADPAPVLEALGEPTSAFPSKSCALNAKDVKYTFPGFELTMTDPAQGDDYVTQVRILDDTYTIPGGITIGSTLADMIAQYGTDYEEEEGFYTYTKDLSTLQISIKDDKAVQILYNYLFENA